MFVFICRDSRKIQCYEGDTNTASQIWHYGYQLDVKESLYYVTYPTRCHDLKHQSLKN